MSQYGKKVVAVIDTQSTFGVTIKQLKQNVDTLQSNFHQLTNLAPGTLDTLQEIGTAINALTNRVNDLETNPDPLVSFNVPTSQPANPSHGDLYFNQNMLKLEIYIDDGNSQQWVCL
jgi:hypothetical protein